MGDINFDKIFPSMEKKIGWKWEMQTVDVLKVIFKTIFLLLKIFSNLSSPIQVISIFKMWYVDWTQVSVFNWPYWELL